MASYGGLGKRETTLTVAAWGSAVLAFEGPAERRFAAVPQTFGDLGKAQLVFLQPAASHVHAPPGQVQLGGLTDQTGEPGARAAGAETERVDINRLKRRGCQADLACKQDGRCRVKDDMQPLYPKIEQPPHPES